MGVHDRRRGLIAQAAFTAIAGYLNVLPRLPLLALAAAAVGLAGVALLSSRVPYHALQELVLTLPLCWAVLGLTMLGGRTPRADTALPRDAEYMEGSHPVRR